MSDPQETGWSRSRILEAATIVHVGAFLVAATWALGGNYLRLRPALAAWGSLGALITLAAVFSPDRRARPGPQSLRWLAPFGLFNALVLVSLATPALLELKSGTETLFVPRDLPSWIPVAAVPRDSAGALWLFDASYLSCFNIVLAVRRRRAVRALLILAVVNSLALSVFGTVQAYARSPGPYFGAVTTRQEYFFSTFIYHNHWGAFAVLMTAASLGLVWRHVLRRDARGFFKTPAFAGIIVTFLLAATAPLSASRACTLLMAALLAGSLAAALSRQLRRRSRRRALPILAAAAAGTALAIAGVWFLAGDTIAERAALSERQFAAMRAQGSIGSRLTLYRDTWRMARDRPWFGWGMASYPHLFMVYNTQQPNPVDHIPIFYSQAHSDWLQSAAEHGLFGSALMGMCVLAPLAGLRRSQLDPISRHLLAGCGLILLYAWVEFPFGSTAVVLSWWLCYFCAIRYARLRAVQYPPPKPAGAGGGEPGPGGPPAAA